MGGASDVYQFSLQRVQESPLVRETLGEPLDAGLFMAGNIQVSGPVGQADISFSIKGPSDKGTVYVKAHKEMGRWIYDQIVIERESDHQRLDLTP